MVGIWSIKFSGRSAYLPYAEPLGSEGRGTWQAADVVRTVCTLSSPKCKELLILLTSLATTSSGVRATWALMPASGKARIGHLLMGPYRRRAQRSAHHSEPEIYSPVIAAPW